MTELFEILTEVWALRALLASSMVGLMCGVLGCFIVLRNMSLVGDALAHAILPGVVVGFLIAGYSALAFFVGAVAAHIALVVVAGGGVTSSFKDPPPPPLPLHLLDCKN